MMQAEKRMAKEGGLEERGLGQAGMVRGQQKQKLGGGWLEGGGLVWGRGLGCCEGSKRRFGR